MAKLKGVIFGVENVLVKPGSLSPHAETLGETGKLVRFLRSKDVESVVMTNQEWVMTNSKTKQKVPLKDAIEKEWGVALNWFQCAKDGVPAKQSAEAIAHVREKMGWEPNETLFIGNSEIDMQSAVNGSILLLNAEWYEKNMEYGFGFDSPKEVARFIDTFCFREHFWYFAVEDGPIRVFCLAPLGSFYDEYKYYSNDFLANVKNGLGQDEDFWTKFLCTSMYFSGLYEGVNYITAYPKHQKGQYQQFLIKPMTTFAKCFRTSYIPDLIARHTTAIKSQFNRDKASHLNQLNSICLNAKPSRIVKGEPKAYANFPIKTGKTVLVIDDVCTKGFSFEAARAYLTATGADVVCVAFLKALKNDYDALGSITLPNGPFRGNKIGSTRTAKIYGHSKHVVDSAAPSELTERLKRYQNWDWPDGLDDD